MQKLLKGSSFFYFHFNSFYKLISLYFMNWEASTQETMSLPRPNSEGPRIFVNNKMEAINWRFETEYILEWCYYSWSVSTDKYNDHYVNISCLPHLFNEHRSKASFWRFFVLFSPFSFPLLTVLTVLYIITYFPIFYSPFYMASFTFPLFLIHD